MRQLPASRGEHHGQQAPLPTVEAVDNG